MTSVSTPKPLVTVCAEGGSEASSFALVFEAVAKSLPMSNAMQPTSSAEYISSTRSM